MNKIEYTKIFKMVHMNEINISTDDFPIIGTQGLGPCVAILVYSEEEKRAIVAHIPDTTKDYFPILLDIIAVYNLYKKPLKYKVIKGYYDNGYKVDELLEKKFKVYPHLFIPFENIPNNAINVDENSTSHEFAFDANTGEFVTEKVFFGYEYNRIHEINNLNNHM